VRPFLEQVLVGPGTTAPFSAPFQLARARLALVAHFGFEGRREFNGYGRRSRGDVPSCSSRASP